ncbi:MAG: ABC transporter permease [Acidobacteriota bacterium]
MSELASVFDATLLHSTFRFATPILLAALGGLLCERAGVFNIALEGLMLIGAFAAVVGSYHAGSVAGVGAALLAGAAMAAVIALFAVGLKGDEIVVGIAVNLLAAGLTVFLLRVLFGVKGAFQDPRIEGLAKIRLPGIDRVPLLGDLLSGHSWLIYSSALLTGVLWLLLFHHPWGLRLRGAGEHPQAAATLGVDPRRTRAVAVIASGALCGLAGAQLSLGNVTLFVEGMSAGRGWIAVVAVLLGRAHPVGVAIACLVFGFTDSLGFRLQGREIPSQFTAMLPYVVTLIGLAVVESRRRRRKG